MPTTVTGTIKTLDTTTPGVTSHVRFWLRGTRGNEPRITGTGAIAPQFSGSAFYVDLPADASGNISGTIYSTRDSAGTGAGDIEAGGSYTAVYYGMQIFNGGVTGPEIPVHAKNGGTLDIANVTPVSTLAVVTAPTGDTTYARIDGGNTPFTGAIQAPKVNSIVFVGSTYATCDAAVAALGASVGVVYIPSTYVGSNCTLPIPANVTVVDLRGGSTQMPARSDTFVTGDYIAYNSTVESALAGLAVQHGRTSPSTTSSAILATSKFTGTTPNASTLAGVTAEVDLVGAVTLGSGVLAAIEGYTAVRSTGGTIADARGLTASVNIDLASATTNITNATSIFGSPCINTSSSGATIANCYSIRGSQPTVGTSRNYAIFSEGSMLMSNNVNLDMIDGSGNPQHIITPTPANDVFIHGLADTHGVIFANQSGSTNWLIIKSTGVSIPSIPFTVGGNSVTQIQSGTSVDLTAQTAAITTTTLFAVVTAGQYRLSWNAKVTTAAGTSSTLGALTIVYTDPDGVVQTVTAAAQNGAGAVATSLTGNTTGALLLGMPMLLNCKAGTNITYAFAYASNAANAMNYNLHIRLESL